MVILALYNVINMCGWVHALHIWVSGMLGSNIDYHELISTISVVQCFAIMEPLMILMGKVKSPLATALIQLASRLMFPMWFFKVVDHALIDSNTPLHAALGIMCVAWSVTEIVRSVFYLTTFRVITILRYNLFVVLYPLGVFGEVLFIATTTTRTIEADLRLLYMLLCGSYGIFFPMLYSYMFAQRAKMYTNLKKRQE